jgi:hypothetical protein
MRIVSESGLLWKNVFSDVTYDTIDCRGYLPLVRNGYGDDEW